MVTIITCVHISERDIGRNTTIPIGAAQPLGGRQPFHFNTGPPKHRQPQKGIEYRSGEGTMYKLPDSSTAGYFSDEGPNKGRPSDPPAPVEYCPLVHPGTVTITIIYSPAMWGGEIGVLSHTPSFI
eukprot:sb/3475599/